MLSTFKKTYSKQNKTKIIFQTNKQKTKTKREGGRGCKRPYCSSPEIFCLRSVNKKFPESYSSAASPGSAFVYDIFSSDGEHYPSEKKPI